MHVCKFLWCFYNRRQYFFFSVLLVFFRQLCVIPILTRLCVAWETCLVTIYVLFRSGTFLHERAYKSFSISLLLNLQLNTDICKVLLRSFDEKSVCILCREFLVRLFRCVLKVNCKKPFFLTELCINSVISLISVLY